MVEKTFKIISNSKMHLTADLISEALLNYFTLDPTKSDVVFGVLEEKVKSKKTKNYKVSLEV
ncbi:MAG: hypothetical protein K9L87_03035 [Candidatus Omnitrophica bacterium]|jgi:hypothetical protein|nr:hypothetical protein [Candidatus Omnitrophota bacterium]MCF7892040.1 hypothetical protein [Candidatus Omnitrophota bacterium]MCF7896185.1 hypothetical protein [Candidatus Omnitrophota bacterium]MCF7897706.1 hypothetical protein [Candidatus Omnitrophota bacterium]MCF7909543.1 hypothetical protein [Candidatus Omnitrophota bacterium]